MSEKEGLRRSKRAKFKMAPIDWVRDGKIQQTGGLATPCSARMKESPEVEVGVQLMVFYKVHSVEATMSVLSAEAEKEA